MRGAPLSTDESSLAGVSRATELDFTAVGGRCWGRRHSAESWSSVAIYLCAEAAAVNAMASGSQHSTISAINHLMAFSV